MMQLRSLRYRKSYDRGVPESKKSSWFLFWETTTGHKADRCCVCGCQNSPAIGLQINVAEDSDRTYILPMCSVHSDMPDKYRFQAWDLDLVQTELGGKITDPAHGSRAVTISILGNQKKLSTAKGRV